VSLGDVVGFATEVLRKSKIDYAVVGGLAVSARGQPRLTRDMDLIVSIRPKEVAAMLDAIEAAGLKIPRRNSVEGKLKAGRPAKIVWDKKFSFDLRLATYRIDTEALRRAEAVQVYGNDLVVIQSEELIVYKLVRFSPVDHADIVGIAGRQSGALDWKWIEKLAEDLADESGIAAILSNLSAVRDELGG